MAQKLKFSSPDGQEVIRSILRELLPHDVHDWNVTGTGQSLDGRDLLVRSATGSGKTGFYLYYLLIILRLSRDPSMAARFSTEVPENPAIIVLFPTNGLEEEMETKFRRSEVSAVAINSHTLQTAQQEGRNLWELAEKNASAIFLSPEQLISKGFERLIHSKIFQARICALGVDEVHLICTWGMGFRKAFQQIGFVRARMSAIRPITIIATTATLRPGKAFDTVCSTLGLVKNQFYDLHRSNHRPEVQIIFRTLHRGLGGWVFPDLAWILTSGRRTIIFCKTIALGFRVTMYLHRLAPSTPPRDIRIRMYNSLNWPSYNLRTRELFRNHPDSQIIVATTSFMVGLDFPHVSDAVLLSSPPDPDEKLQWGGRVVRDRLLVPDGRCITYLTRKAQDTAQAILDGKVVTKPRGGTKSGKKTTKKSQAVEMDADMAALILAPCKVKKVNEIYDNPTDTPCLCRTCTRQPPLTTSVCNCSGCMPEDLPELPAASAPKSSNPVPRKDRLRRTMRAVGTSKLIEFRWDVYNKTDTAASRLLPPASFLPDSTIKDILDRFALLKTQQDLLSISNW